MSGPDPPDSGPHVKHDGTYHSEDVYQSCTRKKRYPDERMARGVASRAFSARGVSLTPHGCWHCGGYHLTKSPRTRP
jgi:hypothetical protein